MATINYIVMFGNNMPIRKKGKHMRRADQTAKARRIKKTTGGNPRS